MKENQGYVCWRYEKGTQTTWENAKIVWIDLKRPGEIKIHCFYAYRNIYSFFSIFQLITDHTQKELGKGGLLSKNMGVHIFLDTQFKV